MADPTESQSAPYVGAQSTVQSLLQWFTDLQRWAEPFYADMLATIERHAESIKALQDFAQSPFGQSLINGSKGLLSGLPKIIFAPPPSVVVHRFDGEDEPPTMAESKPIAGFKPAD